MDDVKPWDQLPDEPDRAYAWFLVYLNLGPGRSIEKAYQSAIASNRVKSRASGQWSYYSSVYTWEARANAFDIETISEHGRDVVVNWVRTLSKLSELAFEKVSGGQIEIRNLTQLLEVINVLGNFVTPETIEAAREFTRGDFGRESQEAEAGSNDP